LQNSPRLDARRGIFWRRQDRDVRLTALRPLMATMALDNVGPDQGEFTSGDGDNDRGRALHFGEESGSDFIVRATCR